LKGWHVRFGSEADICAATNHVRFTPNSDRKSGFLGFLVPLMAIGLGFDAVNGEHSRRTLSRILSQPIYRDALLFGKFIAGIITLAISLLALLHPTTRTLGSVYLSQLEGAVMGAPLPLSQSLLVAWPQIVGLIAASILLFVGSYVAFQRQEVRA
jgi:ABC-type transport system involved in multi-copper enzyme maturation permease subunit